MATRLKEVDAVIVGLGWTGGILAKELAEAGLKVVALERGAMRNAAADYAVPNVRDELRYVVRHELMQNTARDTITVRNNPTQEALPMRRLGSFLPGEVVGGSAVHWSGHTWRWTDMEFKVRSLYQERYGVNLTYVPFVARAAIDGIGRWPWVNAEVQGESAIIKRYVNLGMAVAIDDAKGLMVPVIHGAEEKNLVGLARAVLDLADKARNKTLTPDEMAGGTFTITNPGVFGALLGTPIIPEGQVAILDVEAIVKRPMVVTDEHGNDAIAIRHMMFLCLSYDHRLVDGAYAAQFMAQVKANLESWDEQAFGL